MNYHIEPETRSERRARVVWMTRRGMSVSEIAVIVGASERTVERDRRVMGCARESVSPLTAEQLTLAQRLLDEGCSAAETARTVGCCARTILKRFPARCWTRQQSSEHWSALMQYRHQMKRLGYGDDKKVTA